MPVYPYCGLVWQEWGFAATINTNLFIINIYLHDYDLNRHVAGRFPNAVGQTIDRPIVRYQNVRLKLLRLGVFTSAEGSWPDRTMLGVPTQELSLLHIRSLHRRGHRVTPFPKVDLNLGLVVHHDQAIVVGILCQTGAVRFAEVSSRTDIIIRRDLPRQTLRLTTA